MRLINADTGAAADAGTQVCTVGRGTAGSYSSLPSPATLSPLVIKAVMHMASDCTHVACADEQDAGHGWGPIWPAFEATHHFPRWRGESSLRLSVLHTMLELSRHLHAM